MTAGFYFYLLLNVIDANLSPKRVQWKRHPCRETSGSNCLWTFRRGRSESYVVLLTAGGKGNWQECFLLRSQTLVQAGLWASVAVSVCS